MHQRTVPTVPRTLAAGGMVVCGAIGVGRSSGVVLGLEKSVLDRVSFIYFAPFFLQLR